MSSKFKISNTYSMFDFDHTLQESLRKKIQDKYNQKTKASDGSLGEVSHLGYDDIESILSQESDKYRVVDGLPQEDTVSFHSYSNVAHLENGTQGYFNYTFWAPVKDDELIRDIPDLTSTERIKADNPSATLGFVFNSKDEVYAYISVMNSKKSGVMIIEFHIPEDDITGILYSFISLLKSIKSNQNKIASDLDKLYVKTCQPPEQPLLFWPTNGMISTRRTSTGLEVKEPWERYANKLVRELGFSIKPFKYDVLTI